MRPWATSGITVWGPHCIVALSAFCLPKKEDVLEWIMSSALFHVSF